MLIRLHAELEAGLKIKIEKTAAGQDASLLGAFACGTKVTWTLRVPRRLGAAAVVLRLFKEPFGCPGEDERPAPKDHPLTLEATAAGEDVYRITLDTAALCDGEESGLFYYEFLFLRGWDTLFSDSINNVDMTLATASASKFRMLVYERDYTTPDWFRGGTMYHIFPDRFCRGEGKVQKRRDAILNPDWENGIPQFAKKPGDPLSNNVFFGGNLWGVAEKLDLLRDLGVTVLYLSPIFESASNHRYDTGDYEKVDALLGGDAAFAKLIREAHLRGMRVILDGVFNHTGDDSRYFNRRRGYPGIGAYQSLHSPYADWYTFRDFPDDYECWWGIKIMPRLNSAADSCRRYFTSPEGIAAKWLRAGADGWRLDVADELSDTFLDELRETVKATTNGEGILIGEVWENAADKIAYGNRRRYLAGRQLDSVMNYPFRNAILSFLLERDATAFYNILTELYASYPPAVSHSLMNVLGTHDTKRILTLLGDPTAGEGCTNAELSCKHLSPEARTAALRRLRLASALQFTVFGVPSIYYGDEAGMEGYHDPFCRFPYPWGHEDTDLQSHYRALGALRRRHRSLKEGDFRFLSISEHAVAYERSTKGDRLRIFANMGEDPLPIAPDLIGTCRRDALTGDRLSLPVTLPPESFLILTE